MSNTPNKSKTDVKPVIEHMMYQIILERPENPAKFMIDFLQQTGGYTSNGITIDEKNELEKLRKEIKRYRELEDAHTKDSEKEALERSFSDEDDEIDDNIDKKFLSAKQRLSRQREAVSAEVYGKFNPKENFKPRVIPKTQDQSQRIKARVLQSFLFSNLEKNDLEVVISSMEEKCYRKGEVVIQQGDNGDVLYIVEQGELECTKKFVNLL